MAAFSLTAAGVKAGTGAVVRPINSAEAHVAGQAITSDGYIVDPNDSSKLTVTGLSVATASATSQSVIVLSGEVVVTDSLTPQRQIIAAPSGQLQYDDDLLSGDYYVIVGYTKDANTIVIHPKNTGALKS